jgi:hypothetical protein
MRLVNKWLLIALGIFILPILGITILSVNPPTWIGVPILWLMGPAMIFVLAAPPATELILLFAGEKKMHKRSNDE